MKNDILVHKRITNMDKATFNINTLKVFYCVVQKKIREFFNDENGFTYEDNSFDWDEVDLDYIIKKEIRLHISQLKKIYKGNKSLNEMYDSIRKMKSDIEYESYYDLSGNRLNEKALIIMSLFRKKAIYRSEKEVGFILNEDMADHISNLSIFAKINIDELLKLTTMNEIRLYEYICENNYHDENGNKNVRDEIRKIKIENFKKYFDIPEHYKTNNIEQKFINPAVKGIREKIGIHVRVVKLKLDTKHKNRVSHYRVDVIK